MKKKILLVLLICTMQSCKSQFKISEQGENEETAEINRHSSNGDLFNMFIRFDESMNNDSLLLYQQFRDEHIDVFYDDFINKNIWFKLNNSYSIEMKINNKKILINNEKVFDSRYLLVSKKGNKYYLEFTNKKQNIPKDVINKSFVQRPFIENLESDIIVINRNWGSN